MRRGNDSSAWNEAAGAFTKAREGWISSLYSMGMANVLDKFCPGNALRLIAADVAYMHRAHGSGGLEPDTRVWNAVPRPWDGMQACAARALTSKPRAHATGSRARAR